MAVPKCIRFLAYFMHADVRESEREMPSEYEAPIGSGGNHLDIDEVYVCISVQFRTERKKLIFDLCIYEMLRVYPSIPSTPRLKCRQAINISI